MTVVAMESPRAPRCDGWAVNHIACCPPELLDPIKHVLWDAAAEEDVVKRGELVLRKLDGHDLDVTGDGTVHG